ncbi:hypothetical protein BDV18DRAFT_161354 [Aspergillus unguis]
MEQYLPDRLTPGLREAFLNGPAAIPPDGQESNFDNPPNLSLAGYAIFTSLWATATVCFAIRVYAKAFVCRKFVLSDYAMVVAWALCMGYSSVCLLVGKKAPGIDQWNLRLRDFISLLYYQQIGLIMFGICSFFIKASILFQLIEVFTRRQRDYFFWACHSLIWLNFLYYLIGTFVTIFRCRPINKAWDVLVTDGRCLDTFRLIAVSSAINAVSDIIIFILPQPRIWKLHMPMKKKLALSGVFSFGLLSCAAGVIKLIYVVLMFKRTNNTSYYLFCMGLWTLPELAGGMIAGCLPSAPKVVQSMAKSKLVLRWRNSLRSLVSSTSSHRYPSSEGTPSPGLGGSTENVPPMQRAMRNSWTGNDQFPLGSFASPTGTVLSTVKSITSDSDYSYSVSTLPGSVEVDVERGSMEKGRSREAV